MPKIVVTKNLALSEKNKKRLGSLGDLTIYNDVVITPEEWLERCKGADIICSGKNGLKEKWHELENVFISLPFVGVGFFDKQIMKKRNISVSNSPGCNKDAVSERIIYSVLNLFREFYDFVNVEKLDRPLTGIGLTGKKVCILGKGSIGSRVGKILNSFDMEVSYFLRGDNLIESIKNSDIVINCLTTNKDTIGLLDKKFFMSFKKGSFFVNVCDYVTYDIDGLIESLDSGIIKKAAIDAMGVNVGNTNDPFYKKIQKHDKILATPHIAWGNDITEELGSKMMIDNIEAWIKGSPINLI